VEGTGAHTLAFHDLFDSLCFMCAQVVHHDLPETESGC
jgi:hypothetical protein